MLIHDRGLLLRYGGGCWYHFGSTLCVESGVEWRLFRFVAQGIIIALECLPEDISSGNQSRGLNDKWMVGNKIPFNVYISWNTRSGYQNL